MDKFLQQFRFFIQAKKRILKQPKDKQTFRDLIDKYCDIYDENKVKAEKFMQMLEKLGVIQSQISKETQQFLEEYGIFDEDELDDPNNSPSKDKSVPDRNSKENVPSQGEQEDRKLAKEIKEKEREIERREKKLQISHFHVDELNADYEQFLNDHFEFVDNEVIKMLKFYCDNDKDEKGNTNTLL